MTFTTEFRLRLAITALALLVRAQRATAREVRRLTEEATHG